MDDAERERIARYRRLDDAFRRGDLHALLAELGAQEGFPNVIAAAHGDLVAVDLFLAAGADPDEITRIDDYETALEVAVAAGHRPVVDRLRPLTTRHDWEEASARGDARELARLVEAGHDIDALDGFGQTALMRAAGADTAVRGTGAPGFAGKTAADLAEERGDTRLARFLRAHTR